MSAPPTEDWFSFEGRRNRKSYMLATALLLAIVTVFLVVWLIFAQTPRGESLATIVIGLPAAACNYLLTAQRLRDMNLSGWLALLWVPITMIDRQIGGALTLAALIVLFGVPGSQGPNKFGDDPLL